MRFCSGGRVSPIAVFLRPGKTPDGTKVALVLRHVAHAIWAHWPRKGLRTWDIYIRDLYIDAKGEDAGVSMIRASVGRATRQSSRSG